jgi:translation initiation factor IF-2
MGHVDHGKTTLLDSIRSSNVVSGEAGGITQHIGAYKIETPSGPVVFLDTPGHAAFSAMRARGASVTDLIVLVVAADDGIMPQTIESINHARAANVPLIVAVNKIDKHGVDPDRIRQELTAYEIVPEEWGGETMFVNISALRGDGVDELLESLALQAEILELKANPKKPAYGRVVEARIDKGRGTVVTVLVQEGQLKQSDYMLVGKHYGRIRSLNNHLGKKIKTAGPSTPVEITGLNGVPSAGEEFFLVKNERDAKRIVSSREIKAQEQKRSSAPALPSDPWNVVEKQTQNLIIKADVSGSLEAIKASLNALGTDEVEVNILSSAVGQITESDVMLAQTANANVIGFNVGPDSKAKRLAEQAGTFVERYSIIYELLDAVKDLMSGFFALEIIEERIGCVEVC